jgi:hypothetical protein
MSKEMSVIALGLLVIVIPYLGVPSSWKTPFLLGAGLLIMLLGFLLRGAALSRGVEGSESRPFVDKGNARIRGSSESD